MGKKEEKQNLRIEILEKLTVLVTIAFGLVAALAWNDAVQTIFARFGQSTGIPAKLIYAGAVTIVAVVVTILIGRAAKKAKEKLA